MWNVERSGAYLLVFVYVRLISKWLEKKATWPPLNQNKLTFHMQTELLVIDTFLTRVGQFAPIKHDAESKQPIRKSLAFYVCHGK